MKETTTYPRVCLDHSRVNSTKGNYILIVELDAEKMIHVGSLGLIAFPRGFYAYMGSALGGFKSRIKRHLSKSKKLKWHIDYFLNKARVLQIILCITKRQLECVLAQALIEDFLPVQRFGSSDCRCKSHLYFSNNEQDLNYSMNKAIASLISQYDVVEDIYNL